MMQNGKPNLYNIPVNQGQNRPPIINDNSNKCVANKLVNNGSDKYSNKSDFSKGCSAEQPKNSDKYIANPKEKYTSNTNNEKVQSGNVSGTTAYTKLYTDIAELKNTINNIDERLQVEESPQDNEIYYGNDEPDISKTWISDADLQGEEEEIFVEEEINTTPTELLSFNVVDNTTNENIEIINNTANYLLVVDNTN